MREVTPYRTAEALRQAVDNGGRWYHLFTQQDDGRVTTGELKAAADTPFESRAILFLALTERDLSETEREAIHQMLELPLRLRHDRTRPRQLTPANFEAQAEGGMLAMVSGRLGRWSGEKNLRILQPKAVRSTFADMPVTSYEPVPITQVYDLYELRDRDCAVPLGVARRGGVPLDESVTVAGTIRELTFAGKKPSHHFLMEGEYFTRASGHTPD